MFVRTVEKSNQAMAVLCSYSTARKISFEELTDVLPRPTEDKVRYWIGAIAEFVSTVPHEMIKRFIRNNGIPAENLKTLHNCLPAENRNRRFAEALENGYFVYGKMNGAKH